MDCFNVDAVTILFEYGTYAIICGCVTVILFELIVFAIIKAFNLLKL